jgi:hypothetical protein
MFFDMYFTKWPAFRPGLALIPCTRKATFFLTPKSRILFKSEFINSRVCRGRKSKGPGWRFLRIDLTRTPQREKTSMGSLLVLLPLHDRAEFEASEVRNPLEIDIERTASDFGIGRAALGRFA